jgi:hypothetical protein
MNTLAVIANDLAQHLQSLEYATITGRLNIIQQWARKYYFLSFYTLAWSPSKEYTFQRIHLILRVLINKVDKFG